MKSIHNILIILMLFCACSVRGQTCTLENKRKKDDARKYVKKTVPPSLIDANPSSSTTTVNIDAGTMNLLIERVQKKNDVEKLREMREKAQKRQAEFAEPRAALDQTLGPSFAEGRLNNVIVALENMVLLADLPIAHDERLNTHKTIIELKRIRDALNREKESGRRDMVAIETSFADIDKSNLINAINLYHTFDPETRIPKPNDFVKKIEEATIDSKTALQQQMNFAQDIESLLLTEKEKNTLNQEILDYAAVAFINADDVITQLETLRQNDPENKNIKNALANLKSFHSFMSDPKLATLKVSEYNSQVLSHLEVATNTLTRVPENDRDPALKDYYTALDSILEVKRVAQHYERVRRYEQHNEKALRELKGHQNGELNDFKNTMQGSYGSLVAVVPGDFHSTLDSLRKALAESKAADLEERAYNQKNLQAINAIENELRKTDVPDLTGLSKALSRLDLENMYVPNIADKELATLRVRLQETIDFTAEKMRKFTDNTLMRKAAQASETSVAERTGMVGWSPDQEVRLSLAERALKRTLGDIALFHVKIGRQDTRKNSHVDDDVRKSPGDASSLPTSRGSMKVNDGPTVAKIQPCRL